MNYHQSVYTKAEKMANQLEPCFDKKIFHRFLEEQSDGQEESQVLEHIGSCEKCRTALAELAGQDDEWSDIQQQLAEKSHSDVGAETQDLVRSQQRDLKAVQNILGPTDDPKMIGRLGGYEVCGVIGRGSAGIVVKALETRLNRYVAIKLLAPVYSNNGSSRRRFEREGRAIASVVDQHVVPIHTVSEFQGTPYIVMEYVPDGSLLQRLEKQGPLSTREVVCIGMQIAKGLSAAHGAGIVHRDVKPANVLLKGGVERAMVTDFGLARVVDEATMTRSGSISGTPQYMSPEQARGEAVDPRSDLFSLGSVMYAACTGHSPFRSESVFGVIKRVCDSDPRSIRESNPDIAEWLTGFISKLHSKNPANRFESADQVAELLRREHAHLQSPTIVAEPNRAWWEKKAPVGIESKMPAPEVHSSKQTGWKIAAITAGLLALIGWGAFMLSPADHENNNQFANESNDGESSFNSSLLLSDNSSTVLEDQSGKSLLRVLQQEQEKLPRFENTVETTIDVKEGRQLLFRTNLGTVNIATHEKPTVEMKMIYTVAAKDKETAAKLFKALEMNYEPDTESARKAELSKGKDAVIVAKFPTQKLTEREIAAATNLEELKDQLLIRNNSHYRNAVFTLVIPQQFNIDLSTSAGPIHCSDINGWAKMVTHGGHVDLGSVTGKASVITHGGHVVVGDVGADTDIETHGGHIEVRDVKGQLSAVTHGGHIKIGDVEGKVDVSTHGGKIELGHTTGPVTAKTAGGGITVWKASDSVNANASAGRILVNFVGQPNADSVLASGAGSIQVGIVEGLSLDIDAGTSTGGVNSPFSEKRSRTLKHSLKDGQAKLRVMATTGSVDLKFVEEGEIDERLNEIQEEREEEQQRSKGQRMFDKAYELHMEGKLNEAIAAHEAAAKFANFKGIATYNIGCAWALKGDKDKALAALEEACENGFRDYQQFQTDSDLDSLRDEERFKILMEKMEEFDPVHASKLIAMPRTSLHALVVKGISKYDSKKFVEAEKIYLRALELAPNNKEVFAELGAAIHAQGRLADAYRWHERAAESGECSIAKLGLYNMACVHSRNSEFDEAIQFLSKAIERGFIDVKHIQNDNDLANLRKERIEQYTALIELATSKNKQLTKNKCSSKCEDDECDNEDKASASKEESPSDASTTIGKTSSESGR